MRFLKCGEKQQKVVTFQLQPGWVVWNKSQVREGQGDWRGGGGAYSVGPCRVTSFHDLKEAYDAFLKIILKQLAEVLITCFGHNTPRMKNYSTLGTHFLSCWNQFRAMLHANDLIVGPKKQKLLLGSLWPNLCWVVLFVQNNPPPQKCFFIFQNNILKYDLLCFILYTKTLKNGSNCPTLYLT